jgi:uncharacterized protein (TIGR03067 family)
MKRLITACALLFVCFSMSAQKTGLPGKWQSKNGKRIITLEIGADSTFRLIDGKDTIGGSKFFFGAGPATTSFSVDTSAMPMQIDVDFIEVASGQSTFRMQGIYELRGDRLILLIRRDAGDRPKSFMPRGNKDVLHFSRI